MPAKKKAGDEKDLGFARVDLQRQRRCGMPEVIFGQGKTPEQILKIASTLAADGQPVLVTRTGMPAYRKMKKVFPKSVFHEKAHAISLFPAGVKPPRSKGRICVCAAGTSDIPVAEEAAVTAEFYGNKVDRIYDAGVAGLHRLLRMEPIWSAAHVIIAVAGMEGALPSVIGGLVSVPVIAVPTSVGYGASLGGVTALLGMLNSCSSGVSVVNIDNGFGAGYCAAQITRVIP